MTSIDHGVIIAGAGMSGLGMAIQLMRKLGYEDVQLYERAPDLGGTWHHNRYPGAACDIPMTFYSFSFAQQHWENQWSSQERIEAYLKNTAERFDVARKITFGTEVASADWDEQKKIWTVTVRRMSDGKTYRRTCKVFVSSVGALTIPNECDVPGREDFMGKIFHSARWDESANLEGKDVVLLGNGCSASQIVPTIAPHVKSLTQFGRSRHWYLPRPPIPHGGIFNWLMRFLPGFRAIIRLLMFLVSENDFRMMHMRTGARLRKHYAAVSEKHIRSLAPKKYHKQLIPDFPMGTKRRIFDSNYLASLNHDHVELLAEDPKRITEHGVMRQNGEEIPADIIVLATGFQVQKMLFPMVIRGQKGTSIHDHLAEAGGPMCYYGTVFSGFPNFACILGPNTATGHSSVIFTSECQINFTIKLIEPVLKGRADAVSVTKEAERRDFDWIRREMKDMVWENGGKGKGAKAWYLDDNGRCTALYPKSQIHFWMRSVWLNWGDFSYDNLRPAVFETFTKYMTLAAVVFLGAVLSSPGRREQAKRVAQDVVQRAKTLIAAKGLIAA